MEEGDDPPGGPFCRGRRCRRGRRQLGGQRLRVGPAALQPETGAEGPLLGDLRRRWQPDRLHPLRATSASRFPQRRCRRRCEDATVAIEDKNFFHHGALDSAGIARAAWKDVLAGGKPVQGASTITQQLVRNLYIQNPEETIKRKLIEAHLAYEEEEAHSKDWILTAYLNTAPYGTVEGETAVGAEAAAQTYFGKPAKDLSLTEAALIAGLPQAPSEYNPFLDPHAALDAPQRGAGGDARTGLHHRRRIPRSAAQRPRPQPRPQVPGHPRPLPLRPGPAGADRQIRDQHRPQRRPQGLHDDRPQAAGTARRKPSTPAASATPKAAPPPPSPRSTRQTARSSPSPRPKATRAKTNSTTPGRRTASPAPRSRPTC